MTLNGVMAQGKVVTGKVVKCISY